MNQSSRAALNTVRVFLVLACFHSMNAWSQFVQQGDKLFGTDAIGTAFQGYSVALSSDGTTAIVGGPGDSALAGAVWVYIRSGNTWSQQAKLIGTGATGSASGQGHSVTLSADGNTAVVGGFGDNANTGAVWVFTRNGTTWTQQGNKLAASDSVGSARQGYASDLSADGNTLIVGGYADNANAGAAWVYTRSSGAWTQQGAKLVGSGAVGGAQQGFSVSLSADGNTAIVGGHKDNTDAGAAWIYTRSANVWTQRGSKLIGTGAVGNARQGYSAALSADGNTAIVGGHVDNANAGAAWIYTRSGNVWTQQGSKLVGNDAVGSALQGVSSSLSSDGNTAIVGGRGDDANAGAAWVYTRNGGVWSQLGSKLVGADAVGSALQGGSVAISADGQTAIIGGTDDNALAGAAWVFVAATDTDGDGIPDSADNCINLANATQLDTDADGIGNICDGDFDNSCFVNFGDLGIMKTNFFQNGDLETDMNGDNATNFGDLGMLKGAFFLPPGPSGVPNMCSTQ